MKTLTDTGSSDTPAWIDELDRAACLGCEDPDQFHDEERSIEQQIATVNMYCGRCPIRLRCLSYAVENKLPGIWGGMLESQITKLIEVRSFTKGLVYQSETAKLYSALSKVQDIPDLD